MDKQIITRHEEMTLEIIIYCPIMQNIRVQVFDPRIPNTYLTDRTCEVEGEKKFFIRLPLTPINVILRVFNEKNGNIENDNSFILKSVEKKHLEKRTDLVDFKNSLLKKFIVFAQQFAYNAGNLRTNDINNPNDVYCCDNKYFRIKYLPEIIDYDTGRKLNTPARVCLDAPYFEISQKHFLDYTVPMRFGTLLHEFSHPFLNQVDTNEFEADKNSLFIYLALGYPRIEAHYVWTEIFIETPTIENLQRYNEIKNLIDNFENQNFAIFES